MSWKLHDFVSTALVSGIVTLTIGGVALMAGYLPMPQEKIVEVSHKSQEVDIHLLKIALSVLREDNAISQTPATREWAVDVFNRYAAVKIPDAVKQELIKQPFPTWAPKEMLSAPAKAEETSDASVRDGVIDMAAFEEQRKRQLLQ